MDANLEGNTRHWDAVYADKATEQVSWYQGEPEVSLRLLAGHPGSVVDIGAGASVLAGRLLAAGRRDLTLLDLSATALEATRIRLGPLADQVTFVTGDVLTWEPGRTFDCWHDRAVFHFLTDPAQRAAYIRRAAQLVVSGGVLVLGTFAPDGPSACSGLPTARYNAKELHALYAGHFTLTEQARETHTTPWGTEQHFTWVTLTRT